MYHNFLLSLFLALAAGSWSRSVESVCKEVKIPIAVSAKRFLINATIENDWDAVSLTFNLTRRDSGKPTDPLPIAGTTPGPVQSNFMVSASLCGSGSTVLVLTHGIIESKLYWKPTLKDSKVYSFIDAALAAGYSVLSYDRIGVGSSSKVDALYDAQYQVETAVLDELVIYARKHMDAKHVALVGHSYGAYLSAGSANHTNVDAVVLTGFSGKFDYFAPFLSGASLRVANQQNPKRWAHLDPAYLINSDIYAATYVYFKDPFFEHRVAEWSHSVGTEPFAVGELPSLLASYNNFNNVTAPVFILQGQYDVSACGGNCVGVFNQTWLEHDLFGKAKGIEVVDNLAAGHNLNLHKVAPQAFQMIFKFLEAKGL